MDWFSIITTITSAVFGGGFLVTLLTLKSTRRKGEAEASAISMENTEKAINMFRELFYDPLKVEVEQLRAQVTEYKGTVDSLKTKLTDYERRVRELQARVKQLECENEKLRASASKGKPAGGDDDCDCHPDWLSRVE